MKKFNLLFFLITFISVSHGIDQDYRDLFEHKKILITGGTGFIGKALINEIIQYNPATIVVFSRDEVKHAKLLEEFKGNEKIVSIVGDIRNYESILYSTRDIDLVIHAAALKRIDTLEYHIFESIYANIVGSMNVAKACVENNVKAALLVSTDKACSPVNTYGACKFIAEKIFTNMFAAQNTTRFLVVRYGNVLQSTGSVIPYFCDRIKNNQIISLTHEKMTRFFITKEQAVEHIFKALKYSVGGEIFIPQLPAFKIIDLIYALQKKLGQQVKVAITGLRPGEKIHEIMINNAEAPRTYEFKNMFVIAPTIERPGGQTLYEKFGQRLNIDNFSEYSSGEALLSREELYSFLEQHAVVLKSYHKKRYRRLEY